MNETPIYHFMASIFVTYKRQLEGGGGESHKQKTMNVVFTHTSKNITLGVLNQPRRGVLIKLQEELQIMPDDVTDVVFMNIFPLGLMTPSKFAS